MTKLGAWVGALTILSAFLAPSRPFAQTANFKCPPPGTIVEFSDGQRTTWVGPEGQFCRLQQKGRDGQESVRNWYAPAAVLTASISQTWADQIKPWTLWPLAVGKKIDARYDGPAVAASYSGSWIQKLVVEKYERTTTRAGTFDTFVVLFEQDGISHRFKGAFRQWYAPEAGVTVKFDYSDSGGVKAAGEAISIKR